MAYNTINITQAARPCLVTITHRNSPPEEIKALFYGLFPVAENIDPKFKGAYSPGILTDVRAVVEFEDGKIIKAPVEHVRLLDSPGKFKEYAWGDEEPPHYPSEKKGARSCTTCKHWETLGDDEPCKTCNGAGSGHKDWEPFR